MRIGTILENEHWEEDKVSRFSVFAGMTKGMANIIYQRETGMDNRLIDLSLVGTGNRFSPVGYVNLFGEKSLSSILSELSSEPLPVKKGDFVVVTGAKESSHNNALCKVSNLDEKTNLYLLDVLSEKEPATLLLGRNSFRTREEVGDAIFEGYLSLLFLREAEKKKYEAELDSIDKKLRSLVGTVRAGS